MALCTLSIETSAADYEYTDGISLRDYNLEAEEELILQSNGRVFRTDSTSLFIVSEDGDTLSYLNLIFLDDYAFSCENKLVRYFPTVDYWVVELNGYEWSRWQLINGRSGIEQSAISPPLISPDGTRFLCSFRDLFLGWHHNGIQIWRIEQDSLALEFESVDSMCVWGPSDVHWQSETSIAFKMLFVDWEYWESSSLDGSLELTVDGEWILDQSAMLNSKIHSYPPYPM